MSRRVLIISFVFALTIGVFARILTHDFVLWDDDKNIYENTQIQRDSLSGIPQFWTAPYQGLYIPVTYTTWSLLAYGSGTAVTRGAGPAPIIAATRFHAASFLLHLGSVALVFLLLYRTLGRRDLFAAAAGTALFAFHPLQVESVAWATGLKDVLSGFLALLCLFLYLRHAREQQAGHRGPALLAYAGALLIYLAALLSKPQLVVLPAIIAIFLFLERDHPLRETWANRRTYLGLIPFFICALAAVVLTMNVQPDQDAVFKFEVPGLWLRPIVALDALAFYLGKLLYPFRLSVDYGRNPAVALENALHAPIWIAPLLALGLLFLLRKERRLLFASLAIALVAVLPNLGLIPFAYQGQSTVADRYTYLAMIGIGLFTATLIARSSTPWPRCAALLLIPILAFLSARQAALWKDTVTLLNHAIEVNPAAVGPTYNLGLAHSHDNELDRALEVYKSAIDLKEDFAFPWNNAGTILNKTGRHREAIPYLQKSIALDPDHPSGHINLGLSYAGIGEQDKAIAHFHKALELDPVHAPAFINLGAAWFAKGDFPRAYNYFSKGAGLAPDLPQPYQGMGQSLVKLKKYEAAIEPFRKAISLDSSDPLNWHRLAQAFAHLGRYKEAAAAAARALKLAEPEGSVTPAFRNLIARHYQAYLEGRLE